LDVEPFGKEFDKHGFPDGFNVLRSHCEATTMPARLIAHQRQSQLFGLSGRQTAQLLPDFLFPPTGKNECLVELRLDHHVPSRLVARVANQKVKRDAAADLFTLVGLNFQLQLRRNDDVLGNDQRSVVDPFRVLRRRNSIGIVSVKRRFRDAPRRGRRLPRTFLGRTSAVASG